MANIKAVAIIAVIIVIGLVVAPNMTGMATNVPGTCRGTPTLTLSPNPVPTGDVATATLSGLIDCNGKTVNVRLNNCYGPLLNSYRCTDKYCTTQSKIKLGVAQDYIITACVDKDSDNNFYGVGKTASSFLTVSSKPDVYVKDITFSPAGPKSGQQVQATVTISNKGSGNAYFFNLRARLYDNTNTVAYNNPINVGLLNTFEKDVTDIPGKSEKKIVIPSYSLSPGNYKLKVELDRLDYLIELNEKNNNGEVALKVYP